MLPRYTQLQSLYLTNFRGFKRSGRIPLAPLTFLVGQNSSGKSSVIDAVLLLAQSNFAPLGNLVPCWTGAIVDLGSFDDTVYRHNARLRIRIGADVTGWQLRGKARSNRTARLEISLAARGTGVGELRSSVLADLESSAQIEFEPLRPDSLKVTTSHQRWHRASVYHDDPRNVSYYRDWNDRFFSYVWTVVVAQRGNRLRKRREALTRLLLSVGYGGLSEYYGGAQRVSAGRGDPQRWYSTGSTSQQEVRVIGRPSRFDRLEPSILAVPDARRHSPELLREKKDLSELSAILEELDIASKIYNEQISLYHSAIELRDSITGVRSNVMELGYGTSQVIPVIRAALSPARGPLFVEQPEIHLHPKAQGAVAEYLCNVSRQRQVFVETHSAHMINRARLQIVRGQIPPEHVSILFVSRGREGSAVLPIAIGRDGEFSAEWPGGFFDERYEDTMAIMRARSALRRKEHLKP